MPWGVVNWASVQPLLVEHVWLSVAPTVFGLILALPIGMAVRGRPRVRAVAVGAANAIFTVPSIALFILIPSVIGTPILSPTNVLVALTIYAAALLVRTVIDALDSVPADTRQAPAAIGFSPVRRALFVDAPLAIPVLASGLRVVAVTNVAMVSVGAVIGVGGLGQLFTAGYQRDFPEQILTGIALILVLAFVLDRLIAGAAWLSTPWLRAQGGARVR